MKIKDYLPFTREARQTLIYLIFSGVGPVLTGVVIWTMLKSLEYELFSNFSNLSLIVAAALFIIVTSLGMFVSIRALKLSKDGIEATSDTDNN
jgi:zinc transporter ZupT